MPPMKGGCSANAINAVLCPYGRVILYVPRGEIVLHAAATPDKPGIS